MQEQVTTDKLDDILRKVQGLLAKADHPNTGPEEAETFRNGAEALMFKYRIDEAVLQEAMPVGERAVPQWREIRICRQGSEFALYYRYIFQDAVKHAECKAATQQQRVFDEEAGIDEWWYVGQVCGYDAELRYAEVLFTSCMLAFQQRLEPKYDPTESEQVNAYRLRMAGMEGWRIARLIYGDDAKHLRVRVRGLFKKEALARGEDPTILLGKGNSVKAFREDFALGFADEIMGRLQRMRMNRGEDERGLVLASRNENIVEAFYTRFPKLRPAEQVAGKEPNPWIAPNKQCPKCLKAKSGYCRDHAYLRPRRMRAGRDTNYNALEHGRDAARRVDLGPGSKPKVDGSGPGGELS